MKTMLLECEMRIKNLEKQNYKFTMRIYELESRLNLTFIEATGEYAHNLPSWQG